MALKEALKPPDAPKKAVELLSSGQLDDLSGVQDIIENLKKGDWAGMVGAMMTMWKEYFGTPEEKAEIAKKRKEAKEKATKASTKGDLKKLRSDVDAKKDEEKIAEKPSLKTNPELGDGREYVLIGDSAANGMHLSYSAGKRPSFIGKDGMTTFKVLARLKAERAKLKGKRRAVIYCAGNNILGTGTDKLVDHMVEMAKICHDEGVPEVIVNSQFPPISAYSGSIGQKRFVELKKRNSALLEGLKKAYKEGRFPSGTKVVDLTTPFSDEKGEMKTSYVDPKASDYLHPWKAYKPALDYMMT